MSKLVGVPKKYHGNVRRNMKIGLVVTILGLLIFAILSRIQPGLR